MKVRYNSNRLSTARSRANLKGETTTAMLVHSLAISLVEDHRTKVYDHGRFEAQAVGVIDLSDLVLVVGKALAPSTLQRVLREHPALHVSADRRVVTVYL